MRTVEAVEKAIAMKIDRDGSEFTNARKLAKENNLTHLRRGSHAALLSRAMLGALQKRPRIPTEGLAVFIFRGSFI